MKIKLPYNKLLADPTRTFGVRRLDTGEVVVPLDSDATLDYALIPIDRLRTRIGQSTHRDWLWIGTICLILSLGGLIEADEFFTTRLHI
jgi:hypothetical protein